MHKIYFLIQIFHNTIIVVFQLILHFSAGFYFLHCPKTKGKTLGGYNAALNAAPSSLYTRQGLTSYLLTLYLYKMCILSFTLYII